MNSGFAQHANAATHETRRALGTVQALQQVALLLQAENEMPQSEALHARQAATRYYSRRFTTPA
jgi:hypothetical protein